MRETKIIDWIRKKFPRAAAEVLVVMGDDAAVLRASLLHPYLVITTDQLIENTHFSCQTFLGDDIGYKALSINLSDLAAMGARPRFFLLSLALSDEVSFSYIQQILKGVSILQKKYSLCLLGGNLTRTTGPMMIDITVFGELAKKTKPILRSKAKKNEWIAVTGKLGSAAAGLALLEKWGRKKAQQKFPDLVQAQLRPPCRIEEGIVLSASPYITAGLDLSDSLAQSVAHLAKASQVGIELDLQKIPYAANLQRAASFLKREPSEFFLYGGEDYELLVTLDKNTPRTWINKLGFSIIGETVEKSKGIYYYNLQGKRIRLPNKGWEHWSC